MSNRSRSPFDVAADLFVYAPVGLMSQVSKSMPELVEVGRSKLAAPLGAARVVGEMFVRQHQHEITDHIRRAGQWLTDVVVDVESRSSTSRASQTSQTPRASTSSRTSHATTSAEPRTEAPSPATDLSAATPDLQDTPQSTKGSGASRPSAVPFDFPIPGYSTLSATQIATRLSGLSRDDLEAIRAFESQARKRRTVLHRIDELLADERPS